MPGKGSPRVSCSVSRSRAKAVSSAGTSSALDSCGEIWIASGLVNSRGLCWIVGTAALPPSRISAGKGDDAASAARRGDFFERK